MKKLLILLLILILILLLWWLFHPEDNQASFSGTLKDESGQPIAGAVVSVGEQSTVTDGEGNFTVQGAWVSQERWVIDVRRPGFAPISKVLGKGTEQLDLTAVTATLETVDAESAILVRDIRSVCVGSIDANVDWGAYPHARFPQVFDAGGNRITGSLPEVAKRALVFMSGPRSCSSGFQVALPANSLVDALSQAVQGEVQAELSTVDLYSPDGMLGDYTVASSDAPTYMESYGAGTIEFRSGDEVLQLKKGAKGQVEIPVDQAQIDAGAKIPTDIPLLRYESSTGEWVLVGKATLDTGRMVYVGEVDHFTAFNADVLKTGPACIRFDSSGISGSFDLVTVAPTSGGGFRTRTHSGVSPNPAQANQNLHAVFNLPTNEWVMLRAIKSGTPVGTWIVETAGAWGGTGTPVYDYAACGTIFNLSETVGAGVTHDGATHRFGPLAKHLSFLVNSPGAGEDILPVGGAGCAFPTCLYMFSLFDTGATKVVIDDAMRSTLSLPVPPSPLWDMDVRIDGMDSLGDTLLAPYAAPGLPDGAQAHSGVITAKHESTLSITEEEERTNAGGTPVGGYVSVNYMLAGTPVTNKVVAHIDYTNMITKGPWTFGVAPFRVTAPDIEFYQSGAAGIPTPTLTLFTEGFGTFGPTPTGTKDQRHFLQNVTFTKGSNTVYDDYTLASPVRFMFDTGTTFTVISQAMATTLGATPSSPDMSAGCSSLDTDNFVQLDSIQVVGMDSSDQLATYQINNAEVCVDVADSVINTFYPDPANTSGPPLKVDAVIGSNLFNQAEILWDGPRRTLGILP